MRSRRLVAQLMVPLLASAGALLAGAAPAAAAADGGVITSNGPLTSIQTTADLNCAVNYAGDSLPEFFGTTACGTLIAAGGVLYGPANIPAGGSAAPRTAWTPQSQDSSGSGTALDPYRVVTVVTGGPLRVTQTDLYVVGQENYSTRVQVLNLTANPVEIVVYRAGDCYLQNSDFGFGASDRAAGSVACTAGSAPGSRVEQWAPLTAGSHFYESFYGTVWSRIGSQQDFPDTSEDATRQDNGAGLSWRTTLAGGAEASFSHLTAFSPTGVDVSDTDGDGFPDTWERPDGGVDTNGDGTPDFKLSDFGATPDKPDVFVQVNWTQSRRCSFWIFNCSTVHRRPSLAALRDVQDAFKAHGVRLHVDAGPASLMNPDTNATWGSLSQVANAGIDVPDTIPGANGNDFDWTWYDDHLRSAAMTDQRRARIFHLAMYIGRFNAKGNSGLSRGSSGLYAGRDFMLAYGVFNGNGPTRQQEAGTFMHELGHNLGLSHGGSVENQINWKPNYPSVMNYHWQMSGVPKYSNTALLDYSEGTLNPITESSLDEGAGLEPDSVANDIGTSWACPDGTIHAVSPSVRSVDWNCDNTIGGTVRANVTGVVIQGVRNDTLDNETLRDFNDWAGLIYDGGGALGGAGDPVSAPATTAVDEEPSAQDLVAAAPDYHPVTLAGLPGQLAIRSGTSAPLPVTVTNHRDTQVTYRLSVSASGLTVSGLPAEVTLAAGASQTLPVVVAAGPATSAAYLEIDADGGESSNTAAATTEVYVTDEPVQDQPPVTQPVARIALAPAGSAIAAGGTATFTVTGYDAAGHDLGTPAGVALAIAPDGSCAALTCTATAAGAHTVTATAPVGGSTATATATLTVTAGPAATVQTGSGDGQSAAAGKTFAAPLVAQVVDAYGNPVAGATVTFTVAAGATFTPGGATSQAVTGSSGAATSAPLKAGTTAGPVTVTATTGTATAATFTEMVTEATVSRADLVSTVSAPATTRAGSTFKVTLTVTNRGPGTANRSIAVLILPPGVTVRDAGGGRVVRGAILFDTGKLGPKASASRTVTLTATALRWRWNTRTFYCLALSSTPDPNPFNNGSRAVVTVR
ncbi:zinc-dependent metalloprotease family protein [Dactylosporangium sp. CS-033363]|uniref:zinc-dependent metalloprotease family protein n=1 Tax=Dactylosporangium sp. CS-033363 TaxID=3239935 RepID=UPI003D92B382